MIGLLSGTVALRDPFYLVLNVHGVGYKVLVPGNILSQAAVGNVLTLFIHTHVREDTLELYGFAAQADLKLFEMLISVSGVGCKSGLGVFSIGSRSEIISAILQNNAAFFQSVPRLGKKNAQKIIIELKGKLGSDDSIDLTSADMGASEEVLEALRGFGFTTKEAVDALRSIPSDGLSTEERIKQALKYLAK